jgi:hypothetical protein
MRYSRNLVAALVLTAALAFSQINTARIDGVVTDPTGSAVPAADVTVTNVATGSVVKTSTNEKGEYVVPSMQAATYRVNVSKSGFKVASIENVVMNSGVPATVNVKLEIGQTSETIEVSAGAEIVQATSASVSSTIGGRQLFELPFATRNAVELLVTQPGVQTPTNPRSSSVNGLPRGALNVTIDGMNSQDNMLKSSDGFFSYIYPSVDGLEELTVTSSAGGAEASGQGAAQIKFVSKSGTNAFHGGGFYQMRQTGWNANYYFNNRDGLARDVIKLTQRGLHGGGPIIKDRLFFFVNYEQYKLPGTKSYSRVILTDSARNGIYTYCPTTSTSTQCVANPSLLRTVNVLNLAGAAGFTSTQDPILQKTYSDIAATASAGTINPRTISNSDFSRVNLDYQPTGNQMRHFFKTRLDYNLNSNHHLSLVYDFNKYDSTPDFLNNVVAAFPGTGTVLGSDVNTGQRSNRFAGSLSLRSQFGSHVTNEWRGGLNGGTVLFFDAMNPGLYSTWRGYRPIFPYSLSAVTTATSAQRRNSPVKEIGDSVYYIRGSHQLSFGGTFTQINSFQQIASTDTMPTITFGAATGDPIFTGAGAPFVTANFPGASSTQVTEARDLYTALTGRVSSISKQLTLDENTKQYASVPKTDRNRMREYGLYLQDTWRAARNLTVNLGLRWEKQGAYENLNGLYARVGLDSLYGVSGPGNLFKPGTLTGKEPTFTNGGEAYATPSVWAPSIGLAWQVPKMSGILGKIFGEHDGASVLRGGYAVSTVREGQNLFISIWGSNQGVTQTASLSPANNPGDFGAPGSVLFRQANLPTKSGLLTAPVFPMAASFSTSVNDFVPNLGLGYVQSWNIGWQRELGSNMVMEVRYTGNHGVHLWRQYDLNEVNIVENGFRNEFLIAQNNLRIARGGTITQNTTVNNFGNQGLAGQQAVPIMQTAIGNTTDQTTATYLMMGQAATSAYSIATNATRMANLTAAASKACNGGACPVNMFVVNPTVAGSGSYIVTNDGSSFYDALQVEVRRRLSHGLMTQGSYVWAKSLTNGPTNSSTSYSQPTTLRNLSIDKGPSGYDIRMALKANWIYEMPFGPGQALLGDVSNRFARKALEGWQMSGVLRVQSGLPMYLSGIGTFASSTGAGSSPNNGVVLHNITATELQNAVDIRKTTGSDGKGIVYYLPQDLIDNTLAAFNTGGKTPANLDPTKPYIGPAPAGELGWRGGIAQNWNRFFDLSLVKKTSIMEGKTIEFRASALNVLNLTNFNTYAGIGSTFGQVTAAYRDISGTVEPGGRILEFMLRFTF